MPRGGNRPFNSCGRCDARKGVSLGYGRDGPAGQIPVVARRLRLADEAAIDHVINLARRRQTKTVSCFALADPVGLAGSSRALATTAATSGLTPSGRTLRVDSCQPCARRVAGFALDPVGLRCPLPPARYHLKSMLCLIRRRNASGSVVIGGWSGFGRARTNRAIVFSSGREKRARHRALSPRRHA